jgi:hypothetical protein
MIISPLQNKFQRKHCMCWLIEMVEVDWAIVEGIRMENWSVWYFEIRKNETTNVSPFSFRDERDILRTSLSLLTDSLGRYIDTLPLIWSLHWYDIFTIVLISDIDSMIDMKYWYFHYNNPCSYQNIIINALW